MPTREDGHREVNSLSTQVGEGRIDGAHVHFVVHVQVETCRNVSVKEENVTHH